MFEIDPDLLKDLSKIKEDTGDSNSSDQRFDLFNILGEGIDTTNTKEQNDDIVDFISEHTNTLTLLKSIESSLVSIDVVEVSDNGSYIVKPVVIAKVNSDDVKKRTKTFLDAELKFKESATLVDQVKASYKSYFGAKRKGQGYDFKKKVVDLHTHLKGVFKKNSPAKSGAKLTAVVKNRPKLTKRVLDIDTNVEKQFKSMSVRELTGLIQTGFDLDYNDDCLRSNKPTTKPLLYLPELQRMFEFAVVDPVTGKVTAAKKAKSFIAATERGRVSLGIVVIEQMKNNVYSLLEGQQRITTLSLLLNDLIPVKELRLQDGGRRKTMQIFFSQLMEEEQNYILDECKLGVEVISFKDSETSLFEMLKVAVENFEAVNSEGLQLTTDEKTLAAVFGHTRNKLVALSNQRQIKNAIPFVPTKRSRLVAFLLKCWVYSFNNPRESSEAGYHSNINSVINTMSRDVVDVQIADYLRPAVLFASKIGAGYKLDGSPSRPILETFIAIVTQLLRSKVVTVEDLNAREFSIRKQYEELLRNPAFLKIVKEGTTHQANTQLYLEEKGVWVGRYPQMFKIFTEVFDSVHESDFFD